MTEAPLFDETGRHCLRSVQGQEEGLLFLQKLEEGTLLSCSLGDLLKVVDKLGIPLETVIDMLGEAKVSFDDGT